MKKEKLAVVGIGCRLPGGNNSPKEFWESLINGDDEVTDVPSDRWNYETFFDSDPTKSGNIKSKKGGFVKDINKFDAAFFGYFSEEASQIDPQQRMALEVSVEALEDGGTTLEAISNTNTSVFVAGFLYDHLCAQSESIKRNTLNPYAAMGIGVCSLANRISWCLNLKGPSVSVDTACSGSLVALHMACNSIWNGEAEQALAGGVNALLRPESSMIMSKAGFLSPDGACKAFDASANGYVRSEGCGIVLIKSLSKAIEDNDDIYCIIHNTVVNQDGYTSAGFTVPNQAAQINMLETVYGNAGVDLSKVEYIEAHGPGTPLGDPIETGALGKVLGQEKKDDSKILIGSVKTNIGHLEGASGIAGFIKASLALRNNNLPKNLHFNTPNPDIDFEKLRLKVPTEITPLSTEALAGVNSFGAGGTNAHAVIQAYINQSKVSEYPPFFNRPIFTISAKSMDALKELCSTYIPFVKQSDETIEDICYSLFTRKSKFRHQIYIAANTIEEIVKGLEAFIKGENYPSLFYTEKKKVNEPKLAFVFSGQGGQWAEMGLTLMKFEPVFKKVIEAFDAEFTTVSGFSIINEIKKEASNTEIDETRTVQPAVIAIQIATFELLKHYGINADAVTGHSIGEVASIYASGSITLKQAAHVIYHRARIQNRASGTGKMLAAAITVAKAIELIGNDGDRIQVATINGPEILTISGDEEPLLRISKELEKQNIFNRFVNVKVPYHSYLMEPLEEEIIDVLGKVDFGATTTKLYSTVHADELKGEAINGEYWYENIRKAVLFTDTICKMKEDGFNSFIEIGPHPVLITGILELAKKFNWEDVKAGETLNKKKADNPFSFYDAIVMWLSQNSAESLHLKKGKAIRFPKYAWQHQEFISENAEQREFRLTKEVYPFYKKHIQFASNGEQQLWQVGISTDVSPYVADHKMDDSIIFPGAAHVMMVMAASRHFFPHKEIFLSDLKFENALIVPESKGSYLDVQVEMFNNDGSYQICSKDNSNDDDSGWKRNSRGKIIATKDTFQSKLDFRLDDLKTRFNQTGTINLDPQNFYDHIRKAGLYYGPTFQCIKALQYRQGESLARIELSPDLLQETKRYDIHPSLYDAHLQVSFASQHMEGDINIVYLPDQIERIKLHDAECTPVCWAYVQNTQLDDEWLCSNHLLFNDKGELISELVGMKAKAVSNNNDAYGKRYDECYAYEWLNSNDVREENSMIVLHEIKKCIIIAEREAYAEGLIHWINTEKPSVEVEIFSMDQIRKDCLHVYDLDRRTHIVYFPTDKTEQNEIGANTFEFIELGQAIIRANSLANLFVITKNATVVHNQEKPLNINQSGIIGALRVFCNEYPNIRVSLVDSDYNFKNEEVFLDTIFELNVDVHHSEIAIRNTEKFIRKLLPVIPTGNTESKSVKAFGSSYTAFNAQKGTIGAIEFRAKILRQIKNDEVIIDVKASALNYKDVLNSMGILSHESVKGGLAEDRLGLEVSGIISQVGNDVTDIKVGDEVVARVANGFSGQLISNQNCVVKKPKHYSFEEAAAVPVVYTTAYYGLVTLSRIEAGETVLIHSATGGVGIAAINIAKIKGANIIATAGTRQKRAQLRKDYGITHVFDSRSNSFYDDVMNVTSNRGVDMVLNSLSGDLILQGLKCLAPYGRFVELGKTDIYKWSTINMQLLAENISFHVVDVDRLASQKPKLHFQLLKEVVAFIEEHQIQAIPVTVDSIANVGSMLKKMTRATHVGKMVVNMTDENIAVLPNIEFNVDENSPVIITGGASGLGLEYAEWFAQKGIKNLVLVSRSGCKNESDANKVEAIRAKGINVVMKNCDVSSAAAVQEMIDGTLAEFGDVQGVVHAAGLLNDAMFPNMTKESFDIVFNAKAGGAWNFYQALKKSNSKPDFILLISSMSSVLGLKGQCNYAAANYMEDALCEMWKAEGQNAFSINYGVLGEYAGMSKSDKDETGVLDLLAAHGLSSMRKFEVFTKSEMLFVDKPVHRLVADIEWKKFGLAYPNLVRDSKFDEVFKNAGKKSKGGSSKGMTLGEELIVLEPEERIIKLSDKIANSISDLTGKALSSIDINEPISKWSLDSIMLGQISSWIIKNTGVNYPLIKLVKGPSINEISKELLPQIMKEGDSGDNQKSQSSTIDDGNALFELGVVKLNDWVVRGASTGNESKRIICFHSMGVGASLFTNFLLTPPEDTDIIAIQLPGRENRMSEPHINNIDEVVEMLFPIISEFLDKPYVVWGHSFGGIIAYETIHKIKSHGLRTPEHFNITATIAPDLVKLWQNRDVVIRVLNENNRAEYLTALSRYIENPEFLERILPVMRKDMPLLTSYNFRYKGQLDIPITCWAARQDDMVYTDEVFEWEKFTSGEFNKIEVDGDHWFINSNKELILENLNTMLSVLVTMK
ncbi:MAG: SDR family NAD(P)-dependent oxidoreductase [Flavobacteriales bacterium]